MSVTKQEIASDKVSDAPELVLDIADLSVSYPNGFLAVEDISLQVAAGEIVGVVGESGSGKTTVGLAAAGLLPVGTSVDASRFRVAGTEVSTLKPKGWRALRKTQVGMVFQEPLAALDPTMTIGKQVLEAARQVASTRPEAQKEALELLDLVRLPEPKQRFNMYPHELSGGQRQRVVIAMALAGKPKLLIADEPTTALDVTIQAQILDLLRSMRDTLGLGVLLVSHDISVVSNMAERLVVMLNGRVVQSGTLQQVLYDEPEPYTLALRAAIPNVDAPPRSLFEIPSYEVN
ncbi:MAG: ABC transporter ATP-binding protein [Propionibacteriaceae bacterium]|nr:ABC transporter ATP-binding protein [Propionibacteriaceae bacterium]